MLMGKSDPLCHIFMGKVLGFGAETEGFTADIYSICAEDDCDLEDLKAARGTSNSIFLIISSFLFYTK